MDVNPGGKEEKEQDEQDDPEQETEGAGTA